MRTRKTDIRAEKFESGQERQGLKARHFLSRLRHDLKSCPDTKPSSHAHGKALPQDRVLTQALRSVAFSAFTPYEVVPFLRIEFSRSPLSPSQIDGCPMRLPRVKHLSFPRYRPILRVFAKGGIYMAYPLTSHGAETFPQQMGPGTLISLITHIMHTSVAVRLTGTALV